MSTVALPFKEIAGEPVNDEQASYLQGLFAGLENRGVRFEDLVKAADRAAEVLDLELRFVRKPEPGWQIRSYDLRGRAVFFVELWEETGTVSMLRTEARTSRQRGMSALFAKQVFTELERADAFLETWSIQGPARDQPE